MAALGLAHGAPTSYHPSKSNGVTSNGHSNGINKESLPKVRVLPNTASVEEVVDALKVAGGVVIKNAVAHEDLDVIEKDLRPLLEKDAPWDGDFFPKQTRRCYGLIPNSKTCAEKVIMHPLYQATCAKFLTTKNWFWSGHKKTYATSNPQIMNTVCFSINPGAHEQPLHRDDWCYHVVNKKIDKYPEDLQRDTGLGWFVAAKDATKENGCTRFIPGSHLWEHEREPDDGMVAYAELKKGDGFMMFASCYHGGGANKTVDQERLLLSCFMTRGWLRQEENHYLNMSLEKAKSLPLEQQKLAGYDLSEPFLGWVNSTNPRVVLDPTIEGGKDMVKNENDEEKEGATNGNSA
ncbi:phytanoyl-dioxygenase family protein [Phyllosticta capitalensis]